MAEGEYGKPPPAEVLARLPWGPSTAVGAEDA